MVTKLKRVKSALKEWRQSHVPLHAKIQVAFFHLDDLQSRVCGDPENLNLLFWKNQLGLFKG